MNKGGFSWKRFLGVSAAKANLSRKVGIPITKSGRQRKVGAAMGCCTIISIFICIMALTIVILL